MTTVWIYVDTNHDVGHPDHLKVFATPDAADEWFKENDPEGVAFGYEVIGDATQRRNNLVSVKRGYQTVGDQRAPRYHAKWTPAATLSR